MAQFVDRTGEALWAARGLTVYRGILNDPVCRGFLSLLETVRAGERAEGLLEAFGEMFSLLSGARTHGAQVGDGWQNHLLERVLLDDNPLTRGLAAGGLESLGQSLLAAAAGDLRRLQKLYRLDAVCVREAVLERVRALVGNNLPGQPDLTPWEDTSGETAKGVADVEESLASVKRQLAAAPDWGELLPGLARYHQSNGSGIFAAFRAFRWVRGEGRLTGITEPDLVRLEDLVGYEEQRAEVLANTEMLLAGCPANNMLLYGDRGTGKSSTVKALLPEYAGRGLRLVEISKRDLGDFNAVTAILRRRPQRFILFVDDLSFEETEVEYKELKAILEGGLESRPSNVVIYATSNRRHLVKELFSDRNPAPAQEQEVRRNDTVQEKLSLVDRFGITVLFGTPDRTLYLMMVSHLAGRQGLQVDEEELKKRAIQWERWHNGRSGRTARQFIDYLTGERVMGGRFGLGKRE